MAFYDLHTTDRGLDVARETLRLLRDIAAPAESMYRVGDGRQTDVLRAQVEIARMVEDTLRMQAMREAMTARIDALLDRGPSVTLGAPVLPPYPDSMPTRAWLDSVARDTRPVIRAGLEHDIDARGDSRGVLIVEGARSAARGGARQIGCERGTQSWLLGR